MSGKLEIRVDFFGKADKPTKLGDGSIRIPARIARVGVQKYKDSAGREFKEYRPPEVLFAPEALEAWESLPVAVKHPPGLTVTPSNWKEQSIGHVSGVGKRDGEFVRTALVVSDAGALSRVGSGELIETSAAYGVEIDHTPGTTPDGVAYDQRVTRIVPNHVGIGPEGWGRGGAEVRMLVGDSDQETRDSAAFGDENGRCYPPTMTPAEQAALDAATAKATKLEADIATKDAALVKATAEKDAAIALAATAKPAPAVAGAQAPAQSAAAEVVADGAEIARLVGERTALHAKVLRVDSKIAFVVKDAKGVEVLRPARDVKCDAITKLVPDFRADGKTDAYVDAYFDMLIDTRLGPPKSEIKHDAITGLLEATRPGGADVRADGEDPIVAARAASMYRGKHGNQDPPAATK
jgi:hypothetical protein